MVSVIFCILTHFALFCRVCYLSHTSCFGSCSWFAQTHSLFFLMIIHHFLPGYVFGQDSFVLCFTLLLLEIVPVLCSCLVCIFCGLMHETFEKSCQVLHHLVYILFFLWTQRPISSEVCILIHLPRHVSTKQ